MWITIVVIIIIALIIWLILKRRKTSNFTVVPEVDLNRYAGLWYEIARLPVPFQRGCRNTTAEYGLRPDNTVSVLNKCQVNGNTVETTGVAVPNNSVIDPATKVLRPGTLKVFFDNNPIPEFVQRNTMIGDYNILYLDPDYQYSIVGTADKRALWFLSRTDTVADEVYNDLINRAKKMGFNTDNLIKN